MPNLESAARFEQFARMRLEGRSDVVYRAYDLLSKTRGRGDIVMHLRAAGQFVPSGQIHNVMCILQRRFISWGFQVKTLGEIETMLHEFWVYNKIKHGGRKGWPLRAPEEARKLYDENEAATAAMSPSKSE